MKKTAFIIILCLLNLNCSKEKSAGIPLPFQVLTVLENGTAIEMGGYGSAAAIHPSETNCFYALTDRGPSIKFKGAPGRRKKFPLPEFSPAIGLFRIDENSSVKLIRKIILKNPQGKTISGLPYAEKNGGTGEVPYDINGRILEYDKYGLDPEGLAVLRNGDFWISDEYGPHIVHYNSEGLELERISPVNMNSSGNSRKIPAVFSKRRPNRGMEGLTVTPDGKKLVAIMQSALWNPSKKAVKNKTLTRILVFDISSGNTSQYLYRQERKWNSNSEIAALTSKTFLVIERDGKYGTRPKAQKHIYRVDITYATDVSDNFKSPYGKKIMGKTLEQCSWRKINEAGIKTVSKELIADLYSDIPGHYPHDKPEGLIVADRHTFGVLNDDDFAVTEDRGKIVRKILPGTEDKTDRGTLYIIRTSMPLW